MNEIDTFEFDRQGYIVIPGLLTEAEVTSLSAAVDELEEHALAHVSEPPRKDSGWGANYHASSERGYHTNGERAEGKTLIVEDYWNANPAFDVLLDHAPTMDYVHGIVKERPTINNSEIRIRYKGNETGCHGGTVNASQKYRYSFTERGIDCMMVRMVYFIHDCSNEQGAFCVVPGTHKTHLPSPYSNNPDDDPSMIGLEVKAGDAIFFTENLRHGGLINRSDQVRKTLHVGYGPYWLMSQNIATMDEQQHITPETFARLTEQQRDLFRAYRPKQ